MHTKATPALGAILSFLLAATASHTVRAQSESAALLEPVSDAEIHELLDRLPTADDGNEPWTINDFIDAEIYMRSGRYDDSGAEYIQMNKKLANTAFAAEFPEYWRVTEMQPVDQGPSILLLQAMSPEEVVRMKQDKEVPPDVIAMSLKAYATGLRAVGDLVDEQMGWDGVNSWAVGGSGCIDLFGPEAEREADDLPYSETFAIGNSNPYAPEVAFSTGVFLYGPSCMLDVMSDRMNTSVDSSADGRQDAEEMLAALAATTLSYDEQEIVRGRPAKGVRADNLNLTQPVEGGEMTINSMTAWIDTATLVRLRTRTEGVMRQNGESRPFFMEKDQDDYRHVPGSTLYEPYREVLRMGGILSPAERAQLEETKQKLDEFERQLASMPAGQRQMMERMMGSQMEQMRTLVDDGTFEIEIITTEIIVNPDFGEYGSTATANVETNLVVTIQRHLTTLGYDPGDINGELTRQTVVAITQFEAASNMPVTGQATPQLAGVLTAAVDAQ